VNETTWNLIVSMRNLLTQQRTHAFALMATDGDFDVDTMVEEAEAAPMVLSMTTPMPTKRGLDRWTWLMALWLLRQQQ